MDEYAINILTFNLLEVKQDVYFSNDFKKGYNKIYKTNLPKNTPSSFLDSINKFAWWSLLYEDGDETIFVDFLENSNFAKHYFNQLIYQHFEELGFVVSRNFIWDTEVYVEDHSYIDASLKRFKHFTLRFDKNTLINRNSLLLTYEGETFVHNKNISSLGLNSEILGRVFYENKIVKYKKMNGTAKQTPELIFPIINNEIRKALNISSDRKFNANKYKEYFEQVSWFYQEFLKDSVIGSTIKFQGSGFLKPHISNIYQTSEDSNLLLFGNNKKNFNPYIGLKENGPLDCPNKDNLFKFFFIFHENDKDYANKLFSYLKRGYKSFPGLKSFINLDFDIDQEKTIRFLNRDPVNEIKNKLQNMVFEENITYAAIYISRIRKDGEDKEENLIYYRIKEILLKYKITSQAIFKEKIDNPAFNYFLPNIAVALLAKLGGVPWRLYRPIQNDLIIGVGAKWIKNEQNRYIGSAFCFKNDGSFKGFNVFEKDNTIALSQAIKSAVEYYSKENTTCDRLVIHYYKELSSKEEEPIKKALEQLNLNISYIVLTINETQSEDYVLFDTSFDGKMPRSGTFIKINRNEYLLCNNTRYSQYTKTRIDGFPFPLKIRIKSSHDEKIESIQIVKELMDQVYQFSRMYWKSVRQRNLPVTIEYSKLIAEMVANFENKDLIPFAKNTLWFL